MKFARQLDPAIGVAEWDDWCQAVSVVAWVQGEPRLMVPLDLIKRALERVWICTHSRRSKRQT